MKSHKYDSIIYELLENEFATVDTAHLEECIAWIQGYMSGKYNINTINDEKYIANSIMLYYAV